MDIDFVLSQNDTRPMYQQIVHLIRERVSDGGWPPGYKLPSIREMAIALSVSVITVKRAYLELERESVIVTQQGRGSWVNDETDVEDLRFKELEQVIDRLQVLSQSLGLSSEELISLIHDHLQRR
ncbi:MAG: GntR family transcriptional regulator [Pseudomonadota bacterium]